MRRISMRRPGRRCVFRLIVSGSLVSLFTALAGCQPATTPALFPLDAGRSWTYRLVTTFDDPALAPERETLVLSAHGSETLKGEALWRRRSSTGSDYWLRSDETGIARVASQGAMDVEPQADEPARYVLRLPYVVGTQWTAPTGSYVYQRRNEFPRELRHLKRYQSLQMKYQIEALDELVETPAGKFTGCLRVGGRADIRLYADELFAWKDVPLLTREWYCPGVGLVRVERAEASPSKFIVGGTLTMELTAWR
jgi:hypothetical protein